MVGMLKVCSNRKLCTKFHEGNLKTDILSLKEHMYGSTRLLREIMCLYRYSWRWWKVEVR